MNIPRNHFDIEAIEAFLKEREAAIAAISEDRMKLMPQYAKHAASFEAAKGSRTSFTCSDCGEKVEFYRLLLNWSGVTEIPKLPTLCQSCDRHLKRMEQFFDDNPGAKYYAKTFGNPPKPDAHKAVMAYHPDKHPGGLIATGDSFTGKTTAVVHMIQKQLGRDGYFSECRIVSAAELNDIPAMVMDRTIREFINELCTVELLLLDDLDKTRITPRVASELWTIIERRMRVEDAPTFITMNVRSKRDFIQMFNSKDKEGSDPKQIGLSIYNRLAQSCVFVDFNA